MERQSTAVGHLVALFTILLWGTTFISTKVLLIAFQPVEILLLRFLIGLLVLLAACPHRLKGTTPKQELLFAGAGFCGICLYYLLENIALTLTMASNVGVIVSVAPMLTAILLHCCGQREEPLKPSFFIGFTLAIAGIFVMSCKGMIQFHPAGDLLALLAALVWACYSVLIKQIGTLGFNTILTTRRIFLYGLLFMMPAVYFCDFNWDLTRFANPVYLQNMLFLGIGASALCFVTWNIAVMRLGAVKTSLYIYMIPVITVLTAALALGETITPSSVLGTGLTLSGLVISESDTLKKLKDTPRRTVQAYHHN